MAKRQAVNTEMTPEQVANYARELKDSSEPIEAYLGEVMWDAICQVSTPFRVAHVIGKLNGRKGSTYEIEQVIDTVIARIRGGIV